MPVPEKSCTIGYWKEADTDAMPAEQKTSEISPAIPSWWDKFRPACERGLPCDDCGMCH